MSASVRDIELTLGEPSHDRVIRGSVHDPAEAALGTILFCHGFKGFKDWGPWPHFASRLAARGWRVLRFNFSYCGVGPAGDRFDEPERFAVNTYGRELEDLNVVVARREEWDPNPEAPLGLIGHSRGGLVGLLFASEETSIEAAVTLGAPGRSFRFDDRARAEWRERGYHPIVNQRTGETLRLELSVLDDFEANSERYDVSRALARRSCPTLVIHGTEDSTVPPVEAEWIHEAVTAPRELVLIEGAGHTFNARHPFEEGSAPLLDVACDRAELWFRLQFRLQLRT